MKTRYSAEGIRRARALRQMQRRTLARVERVHCASMHSLWRAQAQLSRLDFARQVEETRLFLAACASLCLDRQTQALAIRSPARRRRLERAR
jgi:hypothetical protein